MNVLIVTPFSMNTIGGITTIVRMLSKEFSMAGHAVSILEPGESTQVKEISQDAHAKLHAAYLREPIVPTALVSGAAAFILKYPLTLWHLHRFLRRARFDLVIVQYPLPAHSYFGVLRRWSFGKLLAVFQGNDAHDLADRRFAERVLVRLLLSNADGVIAVSQSLLAKVKSAFPGLKTPTVLIHNGASVPEHTENNATLPALPRRFVASVGQLVHRKGNDVLIRAVGVLRRKGLRVDAVLVGEGPQRPELEALARFEGIDDSIHLLGNLDNRIVFRLLERAQLLVLPSRAEGFPLVAVEAMAMGRAVIATSIDGLVELIEPGRTGLLVNVDDHVALAGAIERLVEDDPLRLAMGESARVVARERFTWRSVAAQYEAMAAVTSREHPQTSTGAQL